jgi:HAD superfamily hydrolase (TIGR01484 family)
VVRGAGAALVGVPQILLNGALVLGGGDGRVLRSLGLPRPVMSEIVGMFKEVGTLPMVFGLDADGGEVLVERLEPNEVLARYLARRRDTVGAITEVDDLAAALPQTAQEVGTIDLQERVEDLRRRIVDRFGDEVWVVCTESLIGGHRYRWLEVLPPHCNKGTGLMHLAAELDVPKSRIVAIGDNYNDIDMFMAAGHSVAMGNAPDDVREMVDRVAPDVAQNGAAAILEEIADGVWPPAGEGD